MRINHAKKTPKPFSKMILILSACFVWHLVVGGTDADPCLWVRELLGV